MHCIIVVKQVRTPNFISIGHKVSSRKFVRVSEMDATGNTHDIFSWNPSDDNFKQDLQQSYLLAKIAKALDVPISVVLQELERRKQLLLKMVEKNLRDFRSVHRALSTSLSLLDPIDKKISEGE
jgi:hypothetical protein